MNSIATEREQYQAMPAASDEPLLLSVVVTIVDGGDALERCLAALAAQRCPPPLEVLVPYDDTVAQIGTLASRFPKAVFVSLGRLQTTAATHTPGGQHELYDRRRAEGLKAARGELVAILEDRGVPQPDWAATVVRLHQDLPHAVIGGAVENRRGGLRNWAVYFCDFGRYQRPFLPGPRAAVSDVNVSYKRRALEATQALWQERYHEPVVHGALLQARETLFLSPEVVVEQIRDVPDLTALLRERVAWGRLYGHLRGRSLGRARRYAFAVLSPLIPFLLILRLTRQQLVKGVSLWRFVAALPLVMLLVLAWCWGEAAGYVASSGAQ